MVIAQQVVSAGSTENSAVCPGRSTVGTSSAESAAATPRPGEAAGEATAEVLNSISRGVEASIAAVFAGASSKFEHSAAIEEGTPSEVAAKIELTNVLESFSAATNDTTDFARRAAHSRPTSTAT